MESELLSICFMVKNEVNNISAALESVRSIADEIVVVDTGSTDTTKTVVEATLKGSKYKLLDYDAGNPIRSFSEVRNYAISQATCKYVMWMDAGDILVGAEELRKAVEAGAADVFWLETRFGKLHFWRERIMPRKSAEFVDDVHEVMVIDGHSEQWLTDTWIAHTAQQKVGREESLPRNIRMLRAMIEREPEYHDRLPRWTYYLARDLSQAGRMDEAIDEYQKRMHMDGFWEERAKSMVAVATWHLNNRRYEEARAVALKMLEHDFGLLREPYYIIGDSYYWTEKYVLATEWYLHANRIAKPKTRMGVWEDLYTWLPPCQLSYCFERREDLYAAARWALEEYKVAPATRKDRIQRRMIKLLKQF